MYNQPQGGVSKVNLKIFNTLKIGVLSLLLSACVVCSGMGVLAEGTSDYNVKDYNDYLAAASELKDSFNTIELPLEDAKALNSARILFQNDFYAKNEVLVWENGKGKVCLPFSVEEDGLYNLALEYIIPNEGDNNVTFSLLLDGKICFKEANVFSISRLWRNKGENRTDGFGNEFSAEQVQVVEWQNILLYDPTGLNNKPLKFALTKGEHTLSLIADTDKFALSAVKFISPEKLLSYNEYLKNNSKANKNKGEQITIQGESAVLKSENYLISKSDRSSCDVYPNSPTHALINYIGGSNWSSSGNRIYWEFTAPVDGYYSLGFKYQQSYLMNSNVYRTLRIDGEIPFAGCDSLAFPYSHKWKTEQFCDENGNPYLFYLSKGTHSLSLEVTLGEMSDFSIKLQKNVSELGELYREITLITGDNPDVNRDYNLFSQIPNFEYRLTECRDQLEQLALETERMFGSKGGSNASVLRNMTAIIDMMLNHRYQAQSYHGSFYDNYSSVSAWLYETTSMPLDIDEIYIVPSHECMETRKCGVFEKIIFSVTRLATSFISDYNSYSSSGNEKTITLWVNWGRDQVQVLQNLIQSEFTYKTDIGVNIKLTNASLVQSLLSGNGPDCYLHLSRTQPINLAMRSALVDLSEFSDYDQTAKRFMPNAVNPYIYKDGVYALPDTQTFYMMFYRDDILKEYGLSVPETWEEFINVSSVLMRNNLQIGLPYIQITNMDQINQGTGALNLFPTLLQQHGKDIYNSDFTGVDMFSNESVKAFTMLTDFYNEYSFPKTFDFYNRFRTGLMPLGIQSYTMYATLKSVASEIDGLWKIVPIPGVESENGINNSQVAGGTGAVIFKNSDDKKSAWEFLKWWTSADTQYLYSKNVESMLGLVARNPSANVEAVSRLGWEDSAWQEINKQWEKVSEWQEIPGGYYIPRAVDQAFWNVVNGGKTPREMLMKWNDSVNLEISEKISQYEN